MTSVEVSRSRSPGHSLTGLWGGGSTPSRVDCIRGHPTWNGYYSGGLFTKRGSNGQYSIEEINGTIGVNDTALVANRCYVASPFPGESAIYFGGFDPNSNTSTNMAWVFKKEYQVNDVDEIALNKNNFFIYPNPSRNQLYIESEILEDLLACNVAGLSAGAVVHGRLPFP